MDEEEIALKKKLDNTDDIDERRAIRKKLREIRNRKFDEEIQKISSGEIKQSKLVNDINSRKPTKKVEVSGADDDDPYGLLVYTTEEALQNLLSATPFSESDKRRKIRARMRDIRNAAFESSVTVTTKIETSSVDGREIKASETSNHVKQPSPEPNRDSSPVRFKKRSTESRNVHSSEFIREPSPEPLREPSPEPIREPSPEPIREPSPEPIREPSPEPVREPSPEPEREPSPEIIREPSPEPIREPSPEPIRDLSPELVREPSPEPVRERSPEPIREASSPEPIDSPEPDEEVAEGRGSVSPNRESDRESSHKTENKVYHVKKEKGKNSDGNLKEKLKNRQESYQTLSLERTPSKGGVQIDFRSSLRKKTGSPIVNLERKTSGPEQVDFRNALARKVETPTKKDIAGGEQVDFRTALRKKVEKPVFDKSPSSPAQVDFRTALSKKVQTRTIEDKNLEVEQKDFRVVLGKGNLSPKTGRRVAKSRDPQDLGSSVSSTPERISSPTLVRHDEISESYDSIDSSSTSKPSSSNNNVNTSKNIAKKAPPPPPPKKKVNSKKDTLKTVDTPASVKEELKDPVISNVSENCDSSNDLSNTIEDFETPSEENIDNDDNFGKHTEDVELNMLEDPVEENGKDNIDVEEIGRPRNKQIARAERTGKKYSKEESEKTESFKSTNSVKIQNENDKDSTPESEKNNEEVLKSDGDQPTRRRSRKSEDVSSQSRSERNNRRTRRLAALDDKKSKISTEHATKSEDTCPNGEVSEEETSEPEVSTMKKGGIMSRIKYGSDDESESKGDDKKEETNEETVTFNVANGNPENESDDRAIRRGSRRSRKAKDEKIEVSADLLAEINKPKEEPKKVSIESQLKKTSIRSTTPLTGKAAEREAERLKREKEREERAAARAREREEAARKRKEQKEAFERKMAEQKRQRAMKSRQSEAGARASRNAFKEKLEANSPAPASPSNAVTFNTNVAKLLGWVRTRTMGYEGVNVENCSESWADGLAFAALIHSFCPEEIPIKELSKDTRRRNFELAFSVAKEEGVMDLLDVEDMVRMRSPDPKSVITYLHSVYDVFYEDES